MSRSGHIAVYHDLEISGFGLDLSQDLEIEVKILRARYRFCGLGLDPEVSTWRQIWRYLDIVSTMSWQVVCYMP